MSAELQTWKELANYLGVSVRTVQLWEQERGLPVRRLPGARGRILALKDEIDEWRTGQPVLPTAPPAVAPSRWLLAATAIASSLVGAAMMWWYLLPAPLHHFAVENGALLAFDVRGRVSWSFAAGITNWAESSGNFPSVVQTDLDGDGADELLAIQNSSTESHKIVCLDARGRLRWSRILGRAVRTNAATYDPPFKSRGITVLRGFPDGRPRILVLAFHHLYHPSQLLLLDAQGNVLGDYWHSGHVTAVALYDLNHDGHPELLIAGVNQAQKVAEFLVLDPLNMNGASAEQNPNYQILDMPQGPELARALFSRTPLNQLGSTYNMPHGIYGKAHSILVDVSESPGVGRPNVSITYELDSRLNVLRVSPSDYFNAVQQANVREGKLSKIYSAQELRDLLPLTHLKTWTALSHQDGK